MHLSQLQLHIEMVGMTQNMSTVELLVNGSVIRK